MCIRDRRQPHVQTGFRRGPVPRPFVLPSAFAPRWRSGQRRPGGAAARAASTPANAATATGRARSRQDACTREGSAKCGARYAGSALARHARRHEESHRIDMPDGTMRCTATCISSAAIMDASPARPGARCRSRRTCAPARNTGHRTMPDWSRSTGATRPVRGGGTAARMAAAGPSGRRAARRGFAAVPLVARGPRQYGHVRVLRTIRHARACRENDHD